nr:histone-lysine N-methyltransferase, H3 lysine-9 specific SUVH5-like [Coffea arabica]
MSLLTDTSPPAKMPGKRLFEEDSYPSNKHASKFKRSDADSVRSFPIHCGPFTSAMKTIKNFNASSNAVAAERLRIVAPTDVEYGFVRKAILHSGETITKVKAKTDNKSHGDEDDEDCCIIEEKSSNFCKKKLVKDHGGITRKNSSQNHVPGQTSGVRESEEEEERDDEDVRILSASEWENRLQSRINSNNKRKKGNTAEKSVEETEVKDMENLAIVPYDNAAMNIVSHSNVQNALRLFDELYRSLLDEYKQELGEGPMRQQIHIKAAMLLKKQQKWVNAKPCFGHVPGVEIGDQFRFRVELALVGLHHEQMAGINHVTIEGKEYANRVVDSGLRRYGNRAASPDILLYSGQGQTFEDQKLQRGNLALKNSMDAKYPVRVIRKTILGSVDATTTTKKMYIYDGLYKVRKFWPERSKSGKLSLMFELVRLSRQPDCNHQSITKPRRSLKYLEDNNAETGYDVSGGKEKVPIMVVNEISIEKPANFTYITKIMYPHWYQVSLPEGCDCVGGCSDSIRCPCAVKNGGELPFNEEGSVVRAKKMVYECGPNCKCPPSCQNRVSQHGPRLPLEIFRTKSTGWGVRSQVEIPSGSFICEYAGELLQDKEADLRDNDEYLFDLDDGEGFTIDAAKYGNVGRFINHSCSPNLYAQNVLYDHDDKRVPHVMLFATKKIPALKELSYDYNYKLNRVLDANGNIKMKKCFCGSRKCIGRLY